jgi:hypothetical protein
MKKFKNYGMYVILFAFMPTAKAQWVVTDPQIWLKE